MRYLQFLVFSSLPAPPQRAGQLPPPLDDGSSRKLYSPPPPSCPPLDFLSMVFCFPLTRPCRRNRPPGPLLYHHCESKPSFNLFRSFGPLHRESPVACPPPHTRILKTNLFFLLLCERSFFHRPLFALLAGSLFFSFLRECRPSLDFCFPFFSTHFYWDRTLRCSGFLLGSFSATK